MNILIPTDFSESSLESYRFALGIADAKPCQLTVVHFFKEPLIRETTFGIQPPHSDPTLVKALKDRAERSWEEISKRFPTNHSVRFIAIRDDVARGVGALAESDNIDLIVMSTTSSREQDFFVGSTAQEVIRGTGVPVLTLCSPAILQDMKSILIPNDLEPGQEEFVERIRDLQQICGARLHLLYVNTPEKFCSDDEILEKFKIFSKKYELPDCTPQYRNNRSEFAGIVDYLRHEKIDMIAMGTHGRKGLAHLLKGSIAGSVLDRIDKPLWVHNFRRLKR